MGSRSSRSKKRSDAGPSSTAEQQPDELVLLPEVSLGKSIVEALREAGATTKAFLEVFDPDTPDPEWIRAAGQAGWVALTKDSAIRHRKGELEAVQEAKLAMFALSNANLRGAEMAEALVKALPRIRRYCAKHERPFIAKIHRTGEVEMWADSEKIAEIIALRQSSK